MRRFLHCCVDVCPFLLINQPGADTNMRVYSLFEQIDRVARAYWVEGGNAMWALLPTDEMALNSTEVIESFHINHGLPSWLVTRRYSRLIWTQLKNNGAPKAHPHKSRRGKSWEATAYFSTKLHRLN